MHIDDEYIVKPHGDVDPYVTSTGMMYVPVVVGHLRGWYGIQIHKVIVTETGIVYSPTGFEVAGGKEINRKWKLSIRVLLPDGCKGKTAGQWLQSHNLDHLVAKNSPAKSRVQKSPSPTKTPQTGGRQSIKKPRTSSGGKLRQETKDDSTSQKSAESWKKGRSKVNSPGIAVAVRANAGGPTGPYPVFYGSPPFCGPRPFCGPPLFYGPPFYGHCRYNVYPPFNGYHCVRYGYIVVSGTPVWGDSPRVPPRRRTHSSPAMLSGYDWGRHCPSIAWTDAEPVHETEDPNIPHNEPLLRNLTLPEEDLLVRTSEEDMEDALFNLS